MEMKALLYYRSKLNAHDQQVYDQLVEQWMHYSADIRIPEPECEFRKITQAIHWDYPILFYVNYYRIHYCKVAGQLKIKGDYLYTREEAKRLLDECEKWGRYIISNMPPNLDSVRQALWIHDVVINNVTYNKSKGLRAHNLVGVVQDGLAVCEGISMAYKYLCDLADIPCIYISGYLKGGPHGWNMVWLKGETSFVDVTSDLRNLHGCFGRSGFLRTTEEMQEYTWDKVSVPLCRLKNLSKENQLWTALKNRKLLKGIC